MDYFEHPRYKLNKILLRVIGLWPFQDKFESRFFLGFILVISSSVLTAQVRKVIIEGCTLSIILESVPPFIVDFTSLASLINCIMNSDKFYRLMKHMDDDGHEYTGPGFKVIERYADNGQIVIIYYAIWLYCSLGVFLMLPLIPKMIVACGIANISAPTKFAFPADFYIDSEKNYVYLQMHMCTSATMMVTIIVSTDAMFVMLVQHVCGTFAAICYRLENLIESEDLDVNLHPGRADDESFWIISDCIKKHNEAIKFAELLSAAYTWSFFFQMGIDMAGLTFTANLVVSTMQNFEEAVRHIVVLSSDLLHLFFECYFSQRLTDHSLQIFEALKKTKWYKTSIRSRRLLNIMIMRSLKPCELKAGTIYTMSMENYSMMIRTSASYFTILYSMR